MTAYAEVETALAADGYYADRVGHLETAVEQARAAERLAEERYLAGLDNYITVLESQRSAVQAEGDLIAARRLRLENRVDLYLALGGGFEQLPAPDHTWRQRRRRHRCAVAVPSHEERTTS